MSELPPSSRVTRRRVPSGDQAPSSTTPGRHARDVVAPAAEALARLRHVAPPGDVEEPDLEADAVAGGADAALHQRLCPDGRPADEVDLARRDARGLRVLDEGLRVEQLE